MTRQATCDSVLTLEPAAAPEGDYFNSGTVDRDAEDRYFPGWYNDMTPWGYRNQLSQLQVAHDDAAGGNVIEWKVMHVRYLLTTDPFWSDVCVNAKVRMTTPECVEYHDIPGCTESRIGIVLRYEDHRHFYFFAIEGLRRFVLYRRDNDEWDVLAERAAELDPDKYYDLQIEATGSGFRCSCGGIVLTATDNRYPRGRIGIRGNSLGKIAAAQVSMTSGQKRYNAALRSNYEKQVDAQRETYPGLKLAKTLDLSEFAADSIGIANLRNTEKPDILLTRKSENDFQLTALDVEGQVLWQRDKPLADGPFAVYRDAPAGHRELVVVRNDRFEVINLATGEAVAAPAFPRPVKQQVVAFSSGLADRPGNVCGNGGGDILLRFCDMPVGEVDDDKATIMVMDKNFNEQWAYTAEPPGFGHSYAAQFFDVDGDGRDEVMAGYTLLSSDGKPIWKMAACDDILGRSGARHIDFSVMNNFAGDEELDPTLFVCSGGVYVIDGKTGQTRARFRSGHTQGGLFGNLRPDLPGLEFVGRNRWGSMGIIHIINGRGTMLDRFHPDPVGHPSGPINWSGDGRELIFLGTYRGFGLYDGYGRKVVELPSEWCNEQNYRKSRPSIFFADVLGDTRQELMHYWQGVLSIYTQDRPAPDPKRVYDPQRWGNVSVPHWSDGS